MTDPISHIVKETIKLIFRDFVSWFFFWTGELVLTIISLGFHKPRWKGYAGTGSLSWVFAEISVGILGIVFWLAAFPIAYNFFTQI